MCEFCHKHGDGRKWYLQARNYAEDLLSDVRRQRIVREMLLDSRAVAGGFEALDRLERAPQFVQRAAKAWVSRKLKRDHWGQVVPIEDVGEILGFVNSVVRVPCTCRYLTRRQEAGYCYGVTLGPNGGRFSQLLEGFDGDLSHVPDFSEVEHVSREDALTAFRDHETQGLCHTVWTFGTPFIGGVCNCDRVDCLAMQATVQRGVKAFWRAEYVAEVDPDLCVGCRSCMRSCQFGALGYSALDRKASVDQRACYGCGVCRAACSKGALRLRARTEVPVAAGIW
jgi:NAD-dependent dihydropyrimidine dehydrogenase PreA subunit